MIPRRHHVAHGTFVRRWLDAHASMLGLEIVEERERHRIEDYFDTADGRLRRAGFGFVESRDEEGAALVVVPLALDATASESVSLSPGSAFDPSGGIPVALAERLGPLIGRRSLVRTVEVHTHIQPILLRLHGHPLVRVTLEESTVTAVGIEPRVVHAVSIEPMEPSDADLSGLVEAMAEACALTPAPASAALDAMRFAGLPIERTLELGPTRIDRTMTIGEAAFAVLRRQLAAAWSHEPGVRLGLDPEALHDFRVAIRRMRAAIDLYERVLPARIVRLLPLLEWLTRGTGDVRDLDVQLANLARWSESMVEEDRAALSALVTTLSRKRKRARGRMLRLLDSRRAELLFARAAHALRRGPSPRSVEARRPVLDAAAELILGRHRKFVRRARRLSSSSAPEDFHRVRIRAKRLRYAIEFHDDAIGEPAERFTRRLASIQDVLGRHQDAVVALDRLHALLAETTRAVRPRTIFVIGVLAERNASLAKRLRREFLRALGSVRGKRWKDLRAALESGRTLETTHAPHSGTPRHRDRPRRPRLSPGRGALPDAGGDAPHAAGRAGPARDEGDRRRDPDEPPVAGGANGADRGRSLRPEEIVGGRDGESSASS
jgi:CHAD domain-containing protein